MFQGRFQHAIDPKGRISIPSDYRQTLKAFNEKDGELLVISWDDDEPCLVAYSWSEWLQWVERARRLPRLNPEVKNYIRRHCSRAVKCPVDPQGRVLIPPDHRAYAGLNRNVMLVGVIDRIEIWDLDRWKRKDAQMDDQAPHNTESVAALERSLP